MVSVVTLQLPVASWHVAIDECFGVFWPISMAITLNCN